MVSNKIQQLQLLQQNLQNLLLQKQQLESQEIELDSALTELRTTDKSYKIVGKIMLAAPQGNLLKELEEKKEMNSLRLKNILRQEEKLKKSLEETQEEVMKDLKQGKK